MKHAFKKRLAALLLAAALSLGMVQDVWYTDAYCGQYRDIFDSLEGIGTAEEL